MTEENQPTSENISQIEQELERLKDLIEVYEEKIETLEVDIDNAKLNDWKETLKSLGIKSTTHIPQETYKKFAEARGRNYEKLALAELKEVRRKFRENKLMTLGNIAQEMRMGEIIAKLEAKING